jgi:tetratricopeptide (TPR) repeat protein
MKRSLACIACFLLTLISPLAARAFRSLTVGSMMPAATVKDLSGRDVNLVFGRRPVVLFFWRAGQSFSLEALKDLEQVKRQFTQQGVEVFAIEEGRAPAPAVREAVKNLALSYPVYLDVERKVEERIGVIVFPSTGIVGTGGQLTFYLPSRNSNYRQIIQERLRVELGLISETEFNRQMRQIGEELGSDRVRAEDHLKTGLRLSRQGKPKEALPEFEQALSLDRELISAHTALGFTYLELQQPKAAQQEFELVLKRYSASPAARMGLGIAAVRLGEIDRGIEMLQEAVQINPDPVQGYFELGQAYEKKGNLKEALHAYKWAVNKLLQGRR